jgi:hypothetical protein
MGASLYALEIRGKPSTDVFESMYGDHGFVFRAFRTPQLNTVRISPNVYNTEDEIERFFAVVRRSSPTSAQRFFRFLRLPLIRGSGPVPHQGSGGRTGFGSLGRSGVQGGRWGRLLGEKTPPVKMSDSRSITHTPPI